MDESQKTLQRLERLRQLNTDRNWTNTNLYRLLFKEDLYIVAYERIKSAPGNFTPGSDKKTIDGFSLDTIHEIIQEMRTEQFQFQPVRTVYEIDPELGRTQTWKLSQGRDVKNVKTFYLS